METSGHGGQGTGLGLVMGGGRKKRARTEIRRLTAPVPRVPHSLFGDIGPAPLTSRQQFQHLPRLYSERTI